MVLQKNNLNCLFLTIILLGIDRFVPIGKALGIDIIWDGYEVLKSLSRDCVFGIMMKLNKEQILEYQQNRPPYLMIDFAEEVVPGKSAKGYKDFKEDEWFFKVHWPSDPNVPGMLQIEALVQMSALSILSLPAIKEK